MLLELAFSQLLSPWPHRSQLGTPGVCFSRSERTDLKVLIQKGHSAEVDWWALGVMICEMVAGIGNTPFYAEQDHDVRTATTSSIIDNQLLLPRDPL